MKIYQLENNMKDMTNWYHKLIYLVNRNNQFNTTIPLLDKFTEINVSKVLSEKLLEISKHKYPMYVNDILIESLESKEEIYILKYIEILFDPQLKINPVQLFEQLSKTYKLIVEWPGSYKDNQLFYGEYGHHEYYVSGKFEGKVFIK